MPADTIITTVSFTDFIPQIAAVAAGSGLAGWAMRGFFTKPAAAPKATPKAESTPRDRTKNLEAALEKSKATAKSLKAELDALKATHVDPAALETANTQLQESRNALEQESRRTATLEAELKKARETIRHLNAGKQEADKQQKDRSFALENELSKTRQQLALLEARPDDTSALQAEIERLRESVATSTRFAGEARKREAEALEALSRAQSALAERAEAPQAAITAPSSPPRESDRVAAAKAEVLRLLEQNRQQATTPPPAPPTPEESAAEPDTTHQAQEPA